MSAFPHYVAQLRRQFSSLSSAPRGHRKPDFGASIPFRDSGTYGADFLSGHDRPETENDKKLRSTRNY